MNFKSLPKLLDYFKEESTCIEYYENIRWKGNPTCPHCGSDKPYKTNRGYKCSNNDCYKKFTVKVGTIFQNSKIPMRIWYAAIFLATTHKKGISSVQLALDLGITQKSAWFVLHRIREMLKDKSPKMLKKSKTKEIDETYIGGREHNKHFKKRRSDKNKRLTNEGKLFIPKKTVLGIIERKGKVVLKHVANAGLSNVKSFVSKNVRKGTTIYSDYAPVYDHLKNRYKHDRVLHAKHIYVKGDVHTNTIENFWSVLKRGLYGTYHQVSEKHLHKYLDEFAARFNTRKLSSHDKFLKFLNNGESVLTYKKLTT